MALVPASALHGRILFSRPNYQLDLYLHIRTDAFQNDLLDESTVLTVCSTTGNGVEPQSMTAFWQSLIRADLPPNLLDHIDLASFSLGDSSYERFCWAGKKLHRRLIALGAHDILERTDADEQHYLGSVDQENII